MLSVLLAASVAAATQPPATPAPSYAGTMKISGRFGRLALSGTVTGKVSFQLSSDRSTLRLTHDGVEQIHRVESTSTDPAGNLLIRYTRPADATPDGRSNLRQMDKTAPPGFRNYSLSGGGTLVVKQDGSGIDWRNTGRGRLKFLRLIPTRITWDEHFVGLLGQ